MPKVFPESRMVHMHEPVQALWNDVRLQFGVKRGKVLFDRF